MTEQPTTERPRERTEADWTNLEIAAEAISNGMFATPVVGVGGARRQKVAKQVLDALAAAGRLLPEGGSHEQHAMVEAIANNGRVDRQMAMGLDHAQRHAAILQRHWPEVNIYTWHTWTTKPEQVPPVPINEESTEDGQDPL